MTSQRSPAKGQRRLTLATVVLALVAVGLSACGSAPNLRAAAYRVSINNCAGNPLGEATAVAIGPSLLATAAHPFVEFESLLLIGADGDSSTGSLVYADVDADVALIRTDAGESRDMAYLPLADPVAESPIEVGTFAGTTYEPDTGSIVRTLNIRVDGAGERAGMELAVWVESGDSGAAVVADGAVVGVVFASSNTADNRSWAISSSEYVDALERLAGGASPPAPSCQ